MPGMKIAIGLLLVASLVGASNAIKCYSCTGTTNANCGEKLKSTIGVTTADCNGQCQKTVSTVLSTDTYTRSCSLSCTESGGGFGGLASAATYCCSGELCNSAGLVQLNALVMTVSSLLAHLLK